MKERPILFSGPMVQAILDGHKTQTRRIQKEQHLGAASAVICPYGQAGDRLWVKETFRLWSHSFESVGVEYAAGGEDKIVDFPGKSGMPSIEFICKKRIGGGRARRPSIFMYRWASRITLEIVGVRVERLQDITPEDVAAEGIKKLYQGKDFVGWVGPLDGHDFPYGHASEAYAALWDSINGNGAWAQNPWVWVISFKST